MKKVTKDNLDNMCKLITDAGDINSAIVITNKSFGALGSTIDLMALLAGGIDSLIEEKAISMSDLELIVDTIKEHRETKKVKESIDDHKKDLIKMFMSALNIDKKEVEEVLNEEN